MVKRLLKIVAVLVATGGLSLVGSTLAFADSQTPAATNNSQSTTTIQGNTSSSVTNETVQVDDGTQPSAQSTTTDTQSSASIKSTDASSSAISQPALTNDSSLTPGTANPADTNKPASPVSANSSDALPPTTEAAHDKIVQALSGTSAQNQNTFYSGATSNYSAPVAPSASESTPTSQAPAPRQLPPVQGALLGINGALASIVIPQTGKFFTGLIAHSYPISQAALLSLTVILVALVAVGSQFVDFLRRSGFHTGARGDGAIARFTIFATPQKVDANWAFKPSYTPTFLGVRNTNLTNGYTTL